MQALQETIQQTAHEKEGLAAANGRERESLLAEVEKREATINKLFKEREDLVRELESHVPGVKGLEEELWSTREHMREVLEESTKLKEQLTLVQQRAKSMEQEFAAQSARERASLAAARAEAEAVQMDVRTRVQSLENEWAAKVNDLKKDCEKQLLEAQEIRAEASPREGRDKTTVRRRRSKAH